MAIEAKFYFYRIYVSKKLILSKPAGRDLCVYFKKLKTLSHLYCRLQSIILHIFLSPKPELSTIIVYCYKHLKLNISRLHYLNSHKTCFFQCISYNFKWCHFLPKPLVNWMHFSVGRVLCLFTTLIKDCIPLIIPHNNTWICFSFYIPPLLLI